MWKEHEGLLIIICILSLFTIAMGTVIIEQNNKYKLIVEMASKGYEQVLAPNKEIIWKKTNCNQEANVQ